MNTELLSVARKFAAEAAQVDLAKRELTEAYKTWVSNNRIQNYIHRGSVEWLQMMLATKQFYRAVVNAKAREKRAREKLKKLVGG